MFKRDTKHEASDRELLCHICKDKSGDQGKLACSLVWLSASLALSTLQVLFSYQRCSRRHICFQGGDYVPFPFIKPEPKVLPKHVASSYGAADGEVAEELGKGNARKLQPAISLIVAGNLSECDQGFREGKWRR